jgi:hypothetical protein
MCFFRVVIASEQIRRLRGNNAEATSKKIATAFGLARSIASSLAPRNDVTNKQLAL